MSPVAREMPCPACGHSHLYLSCDYCPCDSVVIPGVYPEGAACLGTTKPTTPTAPPS